MQINLGSVQTVELETWTLSKQTNKQKIFQQEYGDQTILPRNYKNGRRIERTFFLRV